jgi:hypothetical protein
LFDMAKSLKIRVRYNIEDKFTRYGNESVNRVVDDLLFIKGHVIVNGSRLIGSMFVLTVI